MSDQTFVRRTRLPVSADDAFAYHARPGAFERLNVPFDPVEVVSQTGGIADTRAEIRTGPLGCVRWTAQHVACEPGRSFTDIQVSGPFAHWKHVHNFVPKGAGVCEYEDLITYRLPLGPLGRLLGGAFVRRKLERAFAYRHRTVRDDLAAVRAAGKENTMKVAITGASGLVGSALAPYLATAGDRVIRVVRGEASQSGTAAWDPMAGTIDTNAITGVDAVVHLAGENIAGKRWNAKVRGLIRDSRIKGTETIATAIAGLKHKPKVLVCASAIGIYGDRGDVELTEESPAGGGFLPSVCESWERAAQPARDAGIRVVHLRFGVVLSPRGGALAKMLLPFQIGAGGAIGGGKQYMSWISLDDAVGAIQWAIENEKVSGAVNAVSPNPVTNLEFTKTMGKVLVRPTILPMPGFAARLAFGEMANDLLLASARVMPSVLQSGGYKFRHPTLEGALRHLLGKE